MTERAVLYEWCLCGGDFSLSESGEKSLSLLLSALKK
jgi:hypothetical protein